jgi:hypothetical protein
MQLALEFEETLKLPAPCEFPQGFVDDIGLGLARSLAHRVRERLIVNVERGSHDADDTASGSAWQTVAAP